jgi:arylsulfatase A-like enzyme
MDTPASSPPRLLPSALAPALSLFLLFGLGESLLYLRSIGRLPHPAFWLVAILLHASGAFLCALPAWTLCRIGKQPPRSAQAISLGLGVLLLLGSTLLFRLLPERYSLLTPPGLAATAAALLLALLTWRLALRRLPPLHSRPLSLILLALFALAAAPPLLSRGDYRFPPLPAAPPNADSGPQPRPPNILLIVLDTLRADRVDRPAAPSLTPNLHTFARESVTFSRTLSVSNHTPPPHASLLTGLYPAHHGVNDKALRFSSDNLTLPERLGALDWRTFAVVANDQLQPYMGWEQGFQIYDDRLIAGAALNGWVNETPLGHLFSKCRIPIARILLTLLHTARILPASDAAAVIDCALQHLDQIAPRHPFFAFLNFMEPHFPYLPPGVSVPADATRVNRLLHAALGGGFLLPDDFDPEILEQLRTLYDGEVRALDQELGRLFAALRDRGLLRDTLVIVTADHGELLGEHNYMLHAYTMYKEVLDVPLIIRAPDSWGDARRDLTDDAIVSTVDVAATILAAAGVRISAGEIEGVSLLPRLRRTPSASPPPISADSLSHQAVAQWYSRRLVAWGPYRAHFKGGELQSITTGNDDLNDISAENPELVDEAYARLHRWREMVSGHAPITPDTRPADAALRNRLRALGYVD